MTIETGATLSARGTEGRNRVVGREQISIAGNLLADTINGHNELVFRDPLAPPLVFATATVVPPHGELLQSTLPPCPVCGDLRIDPPETCDDGNETNGDGCSATCQQEPPGLCDVNGDLAVDVADVAGLVLELFDGDGDRVADVGAGTFRGTAGADANDDERITAADVAGCVMVLLP